MAGITQASIGRNRQSFGPKFNDALMADIDRGVNVAIMDLSALGACPAPHMQWQGIHSVSATETGLGIGKPRVDLDQMFALFLGLVCQFLDQAIPRRIRNMLGQYPVFKHVF